MTTISCIISGQSTLVQLDVLMRADVLLLDRGGRYYFGPLNADEAHRLTRGLRLQ